MLQVLISNKDASQIQVSAGKGGLISGGWQSPSVASPSVLNQRYDISVYVKNIGPSILLVTSSIPNSPSISVLPDSKWHRAKFTVVGDNVTNLNLVFFDGTLNTPFTFFAALPKINRSNIPTENLLPVSSFDFSTGWILSAGGAGAFTITANQTRTFEYTQYVGDGSLVIDDKLNQPAQCQFSLTNNDDTFVIPNREAYVQVFSQQFNKYVFTGFIVNDIPKDFVGLNSTTPSMNFQTYRFSVKATGDEYLLGQKAVPILPPFVNMGAGQILGYLANVLAPGFFDVTSKAVSGDLVPYMEYDPNKNWIQTAKELADQFRYRVKILNKVLYYQPWGDQSFPISYDDTQNQRLFDPKLLTTSIYDTPLVNDIFVLGDAEASDNHEDYFVGDGFTSNFPLRYTAFESDSSLLLKEDWSSNAIDTSKWVLQDPVNTVSLVGALNINGGTNNFGETYQYLRSGIDLGSNVILEHGELFFVGNCSGAIIGGVYDNANTFAEVNGSGQCEFGFDIRPASGFTVSTSVSGTSGLQIQPRRLGQLIGTPVITQQNHYYILRTIVNGRSNNRYTSTFKSFTGAIVSGGTNNAKADITWVISDINLNNTNPLQPGFVNTQPPITDTRFTLRDQTVPAFGLYVLYNVKNANLTIQWTQIFDPPQASLSAAGLSGVSGGQLPLLPNNVGIPLDYEMGFGLGRQVATIGNSQSGGAGGASDGTGSVLQFYSDSIPGVGSRIRVQSWESQTAIARVQDSTSIAKEASIVGDDGHRMAIMNDFKPLPRSSEECELACKAVLLDRTNTIYQGSYGPIRAGSTFKVDSFFDFVNNDFPRPGLFFSINSPKRNINNIQVMVSSVKISYLEMFSEQANITVNFGPTQFLENLLATFITKPNNTLMPKDTAKQPTPIQLANVGSSFNGDLDFVRLTGGPVPGLGLDSNFVYFDVGSIPVSAVEVRRTNFGWGQNNNDRLGLFTTRTFSMPRTQFDQTWYLRQINGPFISRRSKVIRVLAPIVPSPPQTLYADSSVIKAFFNGDIRNIYGIELRGPDNSTVLTQKPVTTPTDMELNLIKLNANQFWVSPNLLLFTEELDNPLWTNFGSVSVSANAALDPNSLATNADLLQIPPKGLSTLDGLSQVVNIQSLELQQPIPVAGTTFTFSTWLRTSGGTATIELVIEDSPFTTGTSALAPVTSTWKRFSVTGTLPQGSNNSIRVWIRSPFGQVIGSQAVFVWGAQLEVGITPSTYDVNVNNYNIKNYVQATEEFENTDFWTTSSGPSVTGGSIAVSLPYNFQGIVQDGITFNNSLQGNPVGAGIQTAAYSANLLGTSINFAGVTFNFGPQPPNLITDVFAGGALSANWTIVEGAFTVAGGQVQGTTAGGDGKAIAFRNDQPFSNDQFAQAKVSTAPTNSVNIGVGVRLGGSVGSPTGYVYYGDNTQTILLALSGSSAVLLGQTNRPVALNDIMQIQVIGNRVIGITNGIVIFSVVDNTWVSGKPGIFAILPSVPSSSKISTFFAGDFPPSNIMYGAGQEVQVIQDYYNSLRILGGSAPSVTDIITVNYTDGTQVKFTQVYSNWVASLFAGNPNELVALNMAHSTQAATTLGAAVDVYHYQYALDSTKKIRSITFPSDLPVFFLAASLVKVNYSTTINPNAVIDPNGFLTADQINLAPKGTNADSGVQQFLTTPLIKNKAFTFSVWLKTSGANITPEVVVQDSPFSANIIDQLPTVTNQWQRFTFTGAFGANPGVKIRIYIGSRFTIAVGAQVLYAWGAQLEYGNSATLYLGNGNVLRLFYLYFFNLMWAYSQATVVPIASPPAPNMQLGEKLSNALVLMLDQLNRGDIRKTQLQISTDGNFLSTGSVSVTGSGQPPTFNVNAPIIGSGNSFFARSKRTDYFSDGPWSPILYVPYGNLIASSFIGGQGSIPPSFDNQSTPLFTYTASAIAPGGLLTGRIVITWPTFTLVFPDLATQLVQGGTIDTGTILTSSQAGITPYLFYPRIKARISGSVVEFVNEAHTSASSNDAVACQTDGFVALGGSTIALTFNVPAAPASGPPSSGGGTGGGSKCIPVDETIYTSEGNVLGKDITLKHLVKSINPEDKSEHFNIIESIKYGEERCIEIELEDGSKGSCSVYTEVPVWKNGEFIGCVTPWNLNGELQMFTIDGNLSSIKSVTNIGFKKVVKLVVIPLHTLFAGSILTHNPVLPKQ